MNTTTNSATPEVAEIFASDVAYPEFVDSLFAKHPDPAVMFAHAALGISTEAFELFTAVDEVNAVEELGDLAFYVVAARNVLFNAGVSGERENADDVEDKGIEARVCELQDLAKRWMAYGKLPDFGKVDTVLSCILGYGIGVVDREASQVEATLDNAIEANRRKLNVRYQAGFSTQAALNRDLAAERVALEG